MTLSAGARLGPYEVVSPLGAGGMGEVWRARDSRLGREVAVKILPDLLFGAPDRVARFEREARSLAALNHPGIAAVHSFEEDSGRHLLVMELVEGEGLDAKVTRGPLPLDEALDVARQIAEALEAAHEKGIVHRDLKPANIKVTPAGRVKLLDFGLAKIFEGDGPQGSSPSVTTSPTLTGRATEAGVILGTAAYMSPEQARGRAVDRRTDVWALGCVLFEILSGRKAFEGETVSDTLAAVLTKDPPWQELPAGTPAGVRRVLRRCLQKDTRARLHDVADLRLELEELAAAGASGAGDDEKALPNAAPASRRSRLLPWLVAAACAALALLATAQAFRSGRKAPGALRSLTASLPAPDGWSFDPLNGPPALSPDGTRLAFAASDTKGRTLICVRSLETGAAVLLPDTDNGRNPFWSPDGRAVGFTMPTTGLAVVPASGGGVELVSPSGPGRGGTWGPDGTILFSPSLLSPIYRVSRGSSERVAVTTLDESRGESVHQWPVFLPDGKHFLYVVQRVDPTSRRTESELVVQALGSAERTVLTKAGSRAVYVPGYLLYAWNGELMAQPFDADRLALSGDAFAVASHVQYQADGGTGIFSASAEGVLVYASGGTIGLSQLTILDRGGKVLGTVGPPGNYWTPHAGPDGRRVAVEAIDPVSANRDIWVFDASGSAPPARITFDAGEDFTPVFSPDGGRVAFSSFRKGSWFVFEKALSGSEEERLLTLAVLAPKNGADAPEPSGPAVPPGSRFLTDRSPDGRFIAFNASTRDTSDDMWVFSPADGEARPILRTPGSERDTVFSPDGRWIAYVSAESGRQEIYVRAFPGPGGKWQVSTSGGLQPKWSRDGKELFYLAPGSLLTAVPVRAGATFEKGSARELFAFAGRRTTIAQYDVFPDGRSFVVNSLVTERSGAPLTFVQGWTERRAQR